MKIIMIILLISTVTIYGFADENENTAEEKYAEMKNLFFGWQLFNNNTEHLSLNFLNFDPFVVNNSRICFLNNSSYNTVNKNLFSSIDNETNFTIQDKIDSFNAFKLWGGLVLMLTGYFENKENLNNYIYLEDQWNKSIKEEQLYQKIIRTNR
ncbi:MAG: hypothetical protein LBI86_04130 [Treponema sp.]|jgi:hypothetical protein|nr:hypothetical protein [Treponema sp.]